MAVVDVGARKLRQVGGSLIVTIPKAEIDRLGLKEGDLIGVTIEPLETRPRRDPEFQAALDAAWEQWEPGLRYLADR